MGDDEKKLTQYQNPVVAVREKFSNIEFSIILTLFVLCAITWGFIALAGHVESGTTGELDRALLLSLRSPSDLNEPVGPEWLKETARDVTALGGIPVLLWLTGAVTGYLVLIKKKRLALVVLLSALGAIMISSGLKEVIDRARPDIVPHATVVYTASFPSGHSMHSASVYLTLAALLARAHSRRRLRTFVLFFATFTIFIVGLSRIFLGVHWPTDVLAGWTAGAGWALLCWLLARWLQRQGQVEGENEEAVAASPGDSGLPEKSSAYPTHPKVELTRGDVNERTFRER